MKNVFFSIIIPVYNVEKYIEECINSVLSQNFSNLEIILVDDGSTDASASICDRYSKEDSRVKVIHKENGGLSDARNTGIEKAIGEYILFIDGDDYIAPDSLIEIEKTIKKGDNPDIICLELVKFFEDSKETSPMKDGIDHTIDSLSNKGLYEYLANLPKYPASACTKAIKRQLFTDNDLMFIKGILSEDLEWCIRLFLEAKTFKYCEKEYYFYRQARNGSISNTSSEKKTMDILNTFNKWLDYAKKINDLAKKKMIYSYMEYIYRFLIIGYGTITKDRRKEYKKQLYKGTVVLGTRKDSISKYIRLTYKFLGLNLTAKLLSKYLKIRKF